MLIKVGWKKDFVGNSVPMIPISGLEGDNIKSKSENMPWWKGSDVKNTSGNTIHVHTVLDVLNDFCGVPERQTSANLRVPISGIYNIKGVGNVLTGRVEQ